MNNLLKLIPALSILLIGCAAPNQKTESFPKFISYSKDDPFVFEIWERADGSRFITDGIKSMEIGGY